MTKKKQWARSFGAHESERTRAVSLTGERIGARQAMELELGYGAVLLVQQPDVRPEPACRDNRCGCEKEQDKLAPGTHEVGRGEQDSFSSKVDAHL